MIENAASQTIQITVKVFGGLREFFPRGRQQLLVPSSSTLSALLQELQSSFPDGSARLTAGLDAGYLNVLMNGRNIRFLHGFETQLHDGDTVAFLPPVGGG